MGSLLYMQKEGLLLTHLIFMFIYFYGSAPPDGLYCDMAFDNDMNGGFTFVQHQFINES